MIDGKVGTLEVTLAAAAVTAESATKPYDGTPLMAGTTLEGFAGGESVTVATTGFQTDVGSSTNTYSVDWNGTAKEKNYMLSESLGTLTVEKNSSLVVIVVPTLTKSGGPLTATEAVAEGLSDVRSAKTTFSGSQTDIGSSEVAAEGYQILDSEGKDAMANFTNVSTEMSLLTVTPASLTAVTPSTSKVHDGVALTMTEGSELSCLVAADENKTTLIIIGSQT